MNPVDLLARLLFRKPFVFAGLASPLGRPVVAGPVDTAANRRAAVSGPGTPFWDRPETVTGVGHYWQCKIDPTGITGHVCRNLDGQPVQPGEGCVQSIQFDAAWIRFEAEHPWLRFDGSKP